MGNSKRAKVCGNRLCKGSELITIWAVWHPDQMANKHISVRKLHGDTHLHSRYVSKIMKLLRLVPNWNISCHSFCNILFFWYVILCYCLSRCHIQTDKAAVHKIEEVFFSPQIETCLAGLISVREYEAYIGEFYVHVTVLHRNKCLYNKNK